MLEQQAQFNANGNTDRATKYNKKGNWCSWLLWSKVTKQTRDTISYHLSQSAPTTATNFIVFLNHHHKSKTESNHESSVTASPWQGEGGAESHPSWQWLFGGVDSQVTGLSQDWHPETNNHCALHWSTSAWPNLHIFVLWEKVGASRHTTQTQLDPNSGPLCH